MPGPRLTALLVALALAGCSGPRERWAAFELQGLTFANLYLSVLDVLGAEGFPVKARDPGLGTIESEWLYGTAVREVFGPSRRRALVRIAPSPTREGAFELRIRVAEEVIRKGGLRATRIRESGDWEPWDDNFDDAEYLAAKIRALLSEHVVTVAVDASGA